MRTLRWIGTVLLACAFGMAWAAPAVLIVQQNAPKRYESDFNVPVGHQIAQSIEDDGRTVPIVWSMTDPVFRLAVSDGLLRDAKDNPSDKEVAEAAEKLKTEYVLLVKAVRNREMVEASAQLLRKGKEVWKDERKIGVTTEGEFDMFNTAATLARTWTMALAEGPWKNLPPAKRVEIGDSGQTGNVVVAPPIRKIDNTELIQQTAKLSREGNVAAVVVFLREAIDSEPLDPGRRRLFFDTLAGMGELKLAAEEARRSCVLFPEAIDLRIAAARVLMHTGDLQGAQSELHEAIARDANGYDTRVLMGEFRLRELDAPGALEHLLKAMEKGTTSDGLFLRSLAYALAGDTQRYEADSQLARSGASSEPLVAAERYRLVSFLCDKTVDVAAAGLRGLFQNSRLGQTGPMFRAELDRIRLLVEAIPAFLKSTPTPKDLSGSHERKLLASNLLVQCLSDVQGFLEKNDPDLIAEATLNLGQALRVYEDAKAAYAAETGPKSSLK